MVEQDARLSAKDIASCTGISEGSVQTILKKRSVPCPSDHTVTGRFYKNSVLKKVKEFYNKKRPRKGWSGVHLLHDNASSHKCEVIKSFSASENVSVLTLFT